MTQEDPAPLRLAPRPGARIEQQAEALARSVLDDRTRSGQEDDEALVDHVQRAFLDEANHALRQILFQISARLELTLVKSRLRDGAGDPLDERVVTNLLDAVERATRIAEAYLDRSRAAQCTIRLRRERFDLARDVRDLLKWHGPMDDPERLRVDLAATPITADRERLRDVLGHLLSRFSLTRSAGQHLVVRIRPSKDGGAEGFLGLDHSRIHAEDLLTELEYPFTIETMEIDVPYTRAVVERHGGTLFVAVNDDESVGFGFTLPPSPENTTEA